MSFVLLGWLERVSEHADLKDHPSIVVIPQTAGTLGLTDAHAREVDDRAKSDWRGPVCVCVCEEEPVSTWMCLRDASSFCGSDRVCVEGFMLCILSLSGWQLTVINISQRTNGEHRQDSVRVCVTAG